jgi:hypothetical protein
MQTKAFDWQRLKERSRWPWVAAAAVTLLSLAGPWTPGFVASIGNCTYLGGSCPFDGQGPNGWSTGAWFVPVIIVALALAYGARRSDAARSDAMRRAPVLLAAGLTIFFVAWLVVKVVPAATDSFAESGVVYTRTFPSGVGWFTLALILFWVGAIAVGRAERREGTPNTAAALATATASPSDPKGA